MVHTTEGRDKVCRDLATPLGYITLISTTSPTPLVSPPHELLPSLGAAALVLLLGLLSILFYKCYIVIDDRRQYAR